jgi:hypothetical protein
MITEITYSMPGGSGATITDSALKYAYILSVIREQQRYYCADPISVTPADNEYMKTFGSPSLIFLNDFGSGGTTDVENELVTVIIKA